MMFSIKDEVFLVNLKLRDLYDTEEVVEDEGYENEPY